MFRHGVVIEFITFVCYYVILKALLQLANIEARRVGWQVPAGVTGLLA
jgi:hypothetical protein